MREIVAIGCPIAHRAWVLQAWFDHVYRACDNAFVTPHFVFVGDPGDDSFRVVRENTRDWSLVPVPNGKGTDARIWNQDRYREMVDLRNRLLGAVREIAPPFFLSLDSDILLHPHVLDVLLDDIVKDEYDAVGAKAYMTQTGRNCPSWGRVSTQGNLQRYDSDGYFRCQVIMAIKLMAPSAYNVDYELHVQGEDIGWSLACERAGLKLAWDGRLGSKHVIEPYLLHCRDPRVGF